MASPKNGSKKESEVKLAKTRLGRWYRQRSRFNKVAIWTGTVLLVLFIGLTILGLTASPIGQWRSEAGRQEYESAYNEAMKRLPAFESSYDIKTDYGTVRAYRWSNDQTRDKTPIVLFPGRTSGVPMWQENINDFIKERPVYALDALGDSGMSVQTKKIESSEDQAKWVEQALAGLQVEKAHMVGHSFGGWTAANYASHYPKRVMTLSLLEPVLTFTDMHLDIYISSIPASLTFLPESWRNQFLEKVGGSSKLDKNDPMTRMILAATNHYASALPLPSMITPEQMRSWRMPAYVAMGASSAIHDSAKAIQVAEENIPNVEARVWPNGTHSLPMESSGEVDASMLRFMRQSEERSSSKTS